MPGEISAIAYALAEGAKLWNQWLISADKRKSAAAIEAGEKYIQTHEDESLPEKTKKQLLYHYKKRFFHFN